MSPAQPGPAFRHLAEVWTWAMGSVKEHLDAIELSIDSATAGEPRVETVARLRARMIAIAVRLMADQPSRFLEANAAFSLAVDAYAEEPTPATLAVMGCSFVIYRAATRPRE